MKTVSILIIICAFFAGLNLSANAAVLRASDIKIAGELTFTRESTLHKGFSDLLESVQELGRKQNARGLHISTGPNDADGISQIWIRADDGLKILVGVDYGVIEVKTGAHNEAYYQRMTSHYHALWEDLKSMGYQPAMFRGGGHLSVGLKELLSRENLTRKFVRDTYRHNELSMGILGFDSQNAVPLQLLPASKLVHLQRLIKQIRGAQSLTAIQKFLQTFEDAYFVEHLRQAHPHLPFREDEFAMNFEHAEDPNFPRIELRAARPQATYEIFLAQSRLLAKRIAWLANQPEDLSFELQTPLVSVDRNSTPPVEPLAALNAFARYLEEIDEPRADHIGYIWPIWESEICEKWLRQ